MNKLSASLIGFIAGILMVLSNFVLYKTNIPETSALRYIGYGILGLAIVFTIHNYTKNKKNSISFGALFNQGFKCFILITLLMTLYSFLFYKLQPQLVDEITERTKKEMLAENKNRTPAEIEKKAIDYKKQLPLLTAYTTIFQYLLIGSIVTLVISGTQILKNKN